jgi:tetratricopeptide (TPR) repeat protein
MKKSASMRRLPALIGAAGAILLLFLAIPQAISFITYELTAPVFENRNNQQTSDDQLKQVRDELLEALSWNPHHRIWSRLGYTYLALANRSADAHEKTSNYTSAEDAFSNAISESPLDPYLWTRLTYVRFITGGKVDGSAAEALKMSLLTGRLEQLIAVDQIFYAAQLWDQLTDDTKETVKEKVRWIVNIDPAQLKKRCNSDTTTRNIVFLSLAEADWDVFQQFVKYLDTPDG